MTTFTAPVLVVEDEYDSQQMVSKILQHQGMEVYVAHNGRECMDMVLQVRPFVVITDLSMPGMDGWETLEALRSNPQTAHIPVIAMTAYHSVAVAADAQRAGFDAYFSKPLDLPSFVACIHDLADGR